MGTCAMCQSSFIITTNKLKRLKNRHHMKWNDTLSLNRLPFSFFSAERNAIRNYTLLYIVHYSESPVRRKKRLYHLPRDSSLKIFSGLSEKYSSKK